MRYKHYLFLIFTPIFIFLFFIYFFFPTGILKEYVVSEVEKNLRIMNNPLIVDIKSLETYRLSGLELEGIKVFNPFSERPPLVVDAIKIRFAFLPLFIGRLSFNYSLEIEKGESVGTISIPMSILWNQTLTKYSVNSTFENLNILGFTDQYFSLLETNKTPSLVLLTPVIKKTSVGGLLNGKVNFNVQNELKDADINLTFSKLYFNLTDKTLNIPIQNFSKAHFGMSFGQDTFTLDNGTEFQSENIHVKPAGTFKIVKNPTAQYVDLNLGLLIATSGQVEKNFGFLIPQLLKCNSNLITGGTLQVKLVGPSSSFKCF